MALNGIFTMLGFTDMLQGFSRPSMLRIPTRDQLRRAACEIHATPDDPLEIEEVVEELLRLRGEYRDDVWEEASELSVAKAPVFHVEFPRFPELPFELRRKIWHHTLEEGRIVEVIYSRRKGKWWAPPLSRRPVPDILLVCKEACEMVRTVTGRCFGTWINPSSDLLWINSLKYEDFNEHYLDLEIDLYQAQGYRTPTGDGDNEDNGSGRLLSRLSSIMITWELWEQAASQHSFICGPRGNFAHNFTNLDKIIFAFVEYVRDQDSRLYMDDRKLNIEDLQKVWGPRNLRTSDEILPVIDRTFGDQKQHWAEIKLLLRGDDGPGGARADLSAEDRSFLSITESLAAGVNEAEEASSDSEDGGQFGFSET